MPTRRANRRRIKKYIADGKLKYWLILHTHSIGGQYPDLLTVFRMPSNPGRQHTSDEHAEKVSKAISAIRKEATVIELNHATK